jgi:hypothetical protein
MEGRARDVVSTNRSQSAQCYPKHWTHYRGRQTKLSSRQNAIRHGLCDETVIRVLEEVEDYKGFEAAILADFNVETAVERELVLRLASVLRRIRRATSIEAEIFRIQAEILRERRLDQSLTNPKFRALQVSTASKHGR